MIDKFIYLVTETVKRLSIMRETCVGSLGREDPLAKEMTTHSSTLGWRIPWMEQTGSLQSMGSQRVGLDLATSLSLFIIYLNRWLSNIWLKCENSAMKVLSDAQISRRGNGSIGIQGPPQSTASPRGKVSFPPKAVLWEAGTKFCCLVTGALCRTNACSAGLPCLQRKQGGKLPPTEASYGS